VYTRSSHVVVPTSYFTHGYPLSLLRHLLTVIPKPQPVSPPTSSSESELRSEQVALQQSQLTNNADTKKWYWPLTFGGRTSPKLNHVATETEKQEVEPEVHTPRVSEVDKSALEDAISTIGISAPIESENATTASVAPDPTPIIEPQRAFVHLSEPTNPLVTRRKEIYYFIASFRMPFVTLR
jgi:hypothetical protein